MIYNVQFIVVIFVLLAVNAKAFQMQSTRMSNTGSMRMALADYREELARTAAAIAAPGNCSPWIKSTSRNPKSAAIPLYKVFFRLLGKGILAVDESTKTIGKRLQSIGIENTEANRQTYRGWIVLFLIYLKIDLDETWRLIPMIFGYFLIMLLSLGLLFSAPGLGKYISGAILYEETLFQSSTEGTPFVDLLKSNGLFPGIKVDTGLQPLPGADPIETW
jgi:Fructose-bisphosphate aldolase class-I